MFSQIKAQWQAGHHEAAVSALTKYLNTHPDDIDGYLLLASFLTILQDFEQAELLLQKTLVKFPHQPSLTYALATLYYQSQAYDQALPLFLSLQSNAETSEDATFMLGETYLQLNQPQRALGYALTAVEQDPAKTDANVLVADIMIQLQMFKQAEPYLAQALKQQPQSAAINFKYGLIAMVLGKNYNDYFVKSRQLDEKYFKTHRQQLDEIARFLDTQHED